MSDAWTTIESDPGVFTELCASFGAASVELQELYSLDDAEFQRLEKPIYGLVFLFKWQQEADERAVLADGAVPELFFAKQVISNACATQAILNVLLNVEDPGVALGATLTDFRAFTADFSAELKGAAISNSDTIRAVHNSFARPEPLLFEAPRAATEDDDVFHFIAYVPFRGAVYELDGLKGGPIRLGDYDVTEPESWARVAAPAVEARIARYAASEVRFNLLAVVRNEVLALEGRLEDLRSAGADEAALGDVEAALAGARARHDQWREENVRRRHNYLPLGIEILKVLAEAGELPAMLEEAKPRWQEKAERLMEARRAQKAET